MEANSIKILLAEDDENLGMLLREYLIAKGYEADLFSNGEKALAGFSQKPYQICILDVMMPIMDGFTVAKKIRQTAPTIPIVFLTAKSMKEDVLEGFNSGADDYMTKPFSIEELVARIEAILRRTQVNHMGADGQIYKIGEYTFDPTKQTLIHADNLTKLTAKESELLLYLCSNRNAVVDRSEVLMAIWQDDSYFNARSMDVYITKLRKFLKEDQSIQIINVRGKGFKLIF
ncbi:MAG TPA: response regulator transcription factor [Williamwhitmania sp.]|nr:response regulator transcription factor [Williamwhitmania sp.]